MGHDGNADKEAAFAEFLRDGGTRKIGPQNAFAHGIAGNAGLDDIQESRIELREKGQAGFSAAPFFRE